MKNILFSTVKKFLGGGIRADHETALQKIFTSAFRTFEDAMDGMSIVSKELWHFNDQQRYSEL